MEDTTTREIKSLEMDSISRTNMGSLNSKTITKGISFQRMEAQSLITKYSMTK
jgi:hypothetical protein